MHRHQIFTILGTMGNLDNRAKARGESVYSDLILNGADILSTDYPIEAYRSILKVFPANSSKSSYFFNKVSFSKTVAAERHYPF